MRKSPIDRLVLFILLLLSAISFAPGAQAAPGDFLFLWGAQQHLNGAAGIAVDAAGDVYVTQGDTVQVFDSAGIRLHKWGSFGSAERQFNHPTGIAVDGNGTMYVADTGNDRVEVLDAAGNYVTSIHLANWDAHPPIAVATDGKGTLYVVTSALYSERDQGIVQAINIATGAVRQVGSAGDGPQQYSLPDGVAVDLSGNVYVLDQGHGRVLLFDATGNFVKVASPAPYVRYGIAVDRSGNIYIAGGEYENFSVVEYDSAGNLIRVIQWFPTDPGYYHVDEATWLPKAVAVDGNGNIYTLDYYDDGLRAFDSAGNPLPQWWTYGTALGQFNGPTYLSIDSRGNVYETDGDDVGSGVSNDRVQVFSADGQPLARWRYNFCQTAGIAINSLQHAYVLDKIDINCSAADVVKMFDLSGTLLANLGTPIPDQTFFGIAFTQNGNFLVTDAGNSTLRLYDSNGNLLRTIGSPGTGNGQFMNPTGIAIDGSGNIYVVDTGNSRIEVFNSSFSFIRKWGARGSGNGYFSLPTGIAVDGAGHVFVADSGNNRIEAFDTYGNFLKSWGTLGDYNGQFVEPKGVAVNSSGTRIYVADTGNNRIEVFQGYVTSTYSISGTVRQGSTTGPILAGATVSIAGKTATTTSTGAFSIAGIPAGTYTVSVSKSGFITKSITGFVVNSNRSGLVFYLSPAGYTVSGTVRDGSAIGPVISGATVSIAGKSCTTSSTGSFSISGLQAGTYTVSISRTGYVTKNITGFVVNSNRSGLVFYLTRGTYTISGTLRQGSSTGPALSGAKVTIAGKATTTSSTGTFTISGIPSGTYTLTFSKSGYLTKTVSGFVVDRNLGALGYYLIGPYSVSGTVREGSATGPVVAGAKVTIDGRSATTGSSGTFSLVGVPGGTFTVTVSKYGYLTTTIPNYFISGNKSGVVFYIKK